jgi:HK97 family phage prohead protease
MTIEYRSFTAAESVEATDEGHVFGLAIPYSRVTTIGNMDHGGFREQIAPGACAKSLREADIVALNNHNSWQPLGRTSAGNLALKSTTKGIEPDLQPIDTSYGADLIKNVKAGIVRGWSFGFEVIKDDWTTDGEPADEYTGTDRTIREMKLVEVSPVTFPAYDQTEISARSAILAEREARNGKSHGKRAKKSQRGSTGLADASTARAGNAPGDGSKPFGSVTYADPGYQKDGQKRYPLDSVAHAKSAWAYINVAANASAYNSEQLASIKTKIKAALTKFGVAVSDEKAAELADEWREKIEAKQAAKKAKRQNRDIDQTPDVPKCPNCGADMNCVKCAPIPKPGDPNVFGANHGVEGDVTTEYEADPRGETRDAKATYADIETCGECGATNQYGAYCSGCGEPMRSSSPKGDYCTSCGGKLDDNRNAHVCETRKDKNTSDLTDGTSKRVPQIVAALTQALKLFDAADVTSLPKDAQTAVALVSSAMTHASHIQKHEGLSPADAISDNDAGSSGSSGRSANPKPDESTSGNLPDDNALILARLHMISRDVELGL